MRMKLTDRAVAGLKPTDRRYDVFDLAMPGFGVRIGTNGSKTWVMTIRRDGARHPTRITLGKFPNMPIAVARAKARAMATGEDVPATVRRGDRFEDLVARFLRYGRTRRGAPLRTASARLYEFILSTVAAPLHGRPVLEIGRADVAELLEQAAAERGDATAALARATLVRFWNWAASIDERYERNPAARAPLYQAGQGSRTLSDSEIAAVWGVGEADTVFRRICRLLLLLGARRREVGGMEWREFQPDGTWLLPAGRAKSHRELRLPLPALAVAEIEQQPQILGHAHVFGRGLRGFADWGRSKAKLDRELGIRPWRIHDLRRSCRTRLHGLGVPHEIVLRILNHDLGKLSRTYDHADYTREVRAALNMWAAELSRIVR
jgi:integrase